MPSIFSTATRETRSGGISRMTNVVAKRLSYSEDSYALLGTPPNGKTILRTASNGSQLSSEGPDHQTQQPVSVRRVSISKASSLTVALSGGNPKSKSGALRRRGNSIFGAYRDAFVTVDDGELIFQSSEDEVDDREVYSILAIREIKLMGAGSTQFQIRVADNAPPSISVATGSSGSSLMSTLADIGNNRPKGRVVCLKAPSSRDAMEWIATIKHELRNQLLVCKNMFFTLQAEGHQERAEPLFEQMIELLRVVYDGREHFEVAETLRSYGKWLESQGRLDEASLVRRQSKAIKRRCEEGLDTTLARTAVPESDFLSARGLPPLGKA